MNLETQAREALIRAFPYIHPGRRELLTSYLMGENMDVFSWLAVEFFLTELEIKVYLLLRLSGLNYTPSRNKSISEAVAEIYQAIDEQESRSTGP